MTSQHFEKLVAGSTRSANFSAPKVLTMRTRAWSWTPVMRRHLDEIKNDPAFVVAILAQAKNLWK